MMDLFAIDDSFQSKPRRNGMGPLVAVGGLRVPGSACEISRFVSISSARRQDSRAVGRGSALARFLDDQLDRAGGPELAPDHFVSLAVLVHDGFFNPTSLVLVRRGPSHICRAVRDADS